MHFRNHNRNTMILFPERIDQDIEENEPVRLLDALVDSLNLRSFYKLYHERGRSPYHPAMMLKVILYAYMNNVYSCRKIEKLLRRDIHFIWLANYEKPDYITINRFRCRVKNELNEIFTQLVLLLAEKGFITLDVEYIDGTKIESRANKYTFVWKKSVERNRHKLQEKIAVLLDQIDESVAQENALQEGEVEFTPEMVRHIASELKNSLETSPAPATKEDKARMRQKKRQVKELEEHSCKLQEYDSRLASMGERNSMSKTDPDATFMRMKEDAMNNGQTKPGYNLQIATENQFITHFDFFHNPTDTLTLIPFLDGSFSRFRFYPSTVVADSGYGSEENYDYMHQADIEAYVKYNRFHIEQRPRYRPNPFSGENFYYNETQDYYVCPMGQHLERIGTRHKKSQSGHLLTYAVYRAQRCEGCPLRGLCYRSKQPCRTILMDHKLMHYKQRARERLTSPEGIRHRGRRCIEPEAVFGQIKANMHYRRFRHFGKDMITMDFTFLAMAFNIKKMAAKRLKTKKNGGNSPDNTPYRAYLSVLGVPVSPMVAPIQKLAA